MRSFVEEINKRVLVYDGSKGYMLQTMGLKGGECPESWNINKENKVRELYELYKNAGSEVIQTNTFQGTKIQLEKYSLGERAYEINYKSAKLARDVMSDDGFVAASVGPTGLLFEPFGELTFDMAFDTFKEQIAALVDGGVDVINFETFTDISEIRAALLAAKEFDVPVICSTAYEDNGRMLMGTEPFLAGTILKSLGAFMIGGNCSFGPEKMFGIIKSMSDVSDIYLSVKPNAGIPEVINGEVIYRETPEKFSEYVEGFLQYGVRLIGGCCGTTPEFIKVIKEKVDKALITGRTYKKQKEYITSAVKMVEAENIRKEKTGYLCENGNDKLINALDEGNLDIAVDRAMELSSQGFDAICINIDKAKSCPDTLDKIVNSIQVYVKEPIIFETCCTEPLEKALKLYRGLAGVFINCSTDKEIKKIKKVTNKYGGIILNSR
jgi:5-methyltetrahydrofolate--homocysteine methyltransferase